MTYEHLQTDNTTRIFVVIHGHFYQPPRENPWTQTVPSQESARPYHDWNERITAECYKPNTRARVLDEHDKIVNVANNFCHINFNVGPTLFTWLEQAHPDIYQNIIEADQVSCQQNHGHGNAIAQVYNHIIMPLANNRDQTTQIIWGIREFRHRFGRQPESVWLPETGINDDTVTCLIEQGVKYIILSPTQAQRVRTIGEQDWADVSENAIDTTQPYRLFLRARPGRSSDEAEAPHTGATPADMSSETHRAESEAETPDETSGRYLDVFFYDGALSNDISFNHLLQDPNALTQRVQELAANSPHAQMLIHVATDGEIYGHHESSGAMSLATLLTAKLPSLNIEVTNYGRYLELFPPTREVELKPGSEQREGTAWSCAHGVGRWYRDCGCCVDNPPGWNQKWRTPLRKGFDRLRDALAALFERVGGPLLHDPWAARDDYIDCILDPSEQTLHTFLDRHAAHPLNDDERSLVLRLLEAQKYSLYTYTSCAWFFNDISGLEPIQNMRYAARAIQLVEGLADQDVEALLLKALQDAASNMPEFGTGQDIYEKYVKPDVYTPERAVNQVLLEQLVRRKSSAGNQSGKKRKAPPLVTRDEQQKHSYTLRCLELVTWQDLLKKTSGEQKEDESPPDTSVDVSSLANVYSGTFQVTESATRQTWKLVFTVFMDHEMQPVSYLKSLDQDQDFSGVTSDLLRDAPQDIIQGDIVKLAAFLEQSGLQRYSLADFYPEDQEALFATMLQEYGQRIETHIETVYNDSLELLEYLTSMHLQVPAKFHASAEFSLAYHLMIEMEKLTSKEVGDYSPALLCAALHKVLRLAETHQLTLDRKLLQHRLSEALVHYLAKLSYRFLSLQQDTADLSRTQAFGEFLQLLRETFELMEQARALDVWVDRTELQNMTYDILEDTMPRYLTMLKTALQNAGQPESESTHHELHRFFQEYKFLHECLQLARQLNFNIDRYREFLISAELTMNPGFMVNM